MLKFLRKYQLILLGVGGTLLLIVFLLGPVIQQIQPKPGRAVVAQVGGQPITADEQAAAEEEARLFRGLLAPQEQLFIPIEEDNATWHWLLLRREAERAGYIGGPADGIRLFQERLAPAFAQQTGQPVTEIIEALNDPQQRSNFARQLRFRSLEQFDTAGARIAGVMRMINTYFDSMLLMSDRQAYSLAAAAEGQAIVDLVVAGTDVTAPEIPEPTEEELAAALELFQDSRPGEVSEDNPFGFGYIRPERIKFETLVVDANAIREAIQVPYLAVREAWLQSQDEYGEPFEDVQDRVESDVKDAIVEDMLAAADREVRGFVSSATRDLAKARDGTFVLPENWDSMCPALGEARLRVISALQSGFTDRLDAEPNLQDAVRVERFNDRWYADSDFMLSTGPFGFAQFSVIGQQVPVRFLPMVVAAEEVEPGSPLARIRTGLPVQVGVPLASPPAIGPNGSRYYVLVTDIRGMSPPDDLSEVREQVARDVRTRNAYELLTADLESLAETSESEGLEALANTLTARKTQSTPDELDNVSPFERVTPQYDVSVSSAGVLARGNRLDQRLNTAEIREQILEAAEGLGPDAGPDSPDRYITVQNPAGRAIGIVRIRAFRPFTQDQYRAAPSLNSRTFGDSIAANVESQALLEALQTEGVSPFTYQALRDRIGLAIEDDDTPSIGPAETEDEA